MMTKVVATEMEDSRIQYVLWDQNNNNNSKGLLNVGSDKKRGTHDYLWVSSLMVQGSNEKQDNTQIKQITSFKNFVEIKIKKILNCFKF